MGEIQGEGYELYRPGDMAMNAAEENRRRIGELLNRINSLEKQVAVLVRILDKQSGGQL